jgi:hypothetical protein
VGYPHTEVDIFLHKTTATYSLQGSCSGQGVKAMSSPDHTPRAWEEVVEAAAKEKDPIKLAKLIEELSEVIAEKQAKPSQEPDRPHVESVQNRLAANKRT